MHFSFIEILASFMVLFTVLLSIAIKLFLSNTGIVLPNVR